MHKFTYGLLAALSFVAASQSVSAEQASQTTRQAMYEAHSHRYVADRTRYVTPRVTRHVNPASQRLVYVDRSTRYNGNVYSGYGSQAPAREVRSRAYATPATVNYVEATDRDSTARHLVEADTERVVQVQPVDDSRRYARYKNARSYDGYTHSRSYTSRAYHPQRVYQPVYHRPTYVSYGYAYGPGYSHCDSYGYASYRHGHGHYYGHRRHGGYGYYGHHRGHHHWHTGFSVHFRF